VGSRRTETKIYKYWHYKLAIYDRAIDGFELKLSTCEGSPLAGRKRNAFRGRGQNPYRVACHRAPL